MGASSLLLSFAESFRQAPGVTEAAEKLATSGPMGLALVVETLVIAYLALEIRKIQKDRLDDEKLRTQAEKNNAKEMLNLADRTNGVVNQVSNGLNSVNETLKETNETNKEVVDALRESTEVMRSIRGTPLRR